MATSFGINKALGLLLGRTTFVVDQAGRVHLAYSSTLQARTHIDPALGAVQALP